MKVNQSPNKACWWSAGDRGAAWQPARIRTSPTLRRWALGVRRDRQVTCQTSVCSPVRGLADPPVPEGAGGAARGAGLSRPWVPVPRRSPQPPLQAHIWMQAAACCLATVACPSPLWKETCQCPLRSILERKAVNTGGWERPGGQLAGLSAGEETTSA